MEKLDQSMIALGVDWLIVMDEPELVMLADPAAMAPPVGRAGAAAAALADRRRPSALVVAKRLNLSFGNRLITHPSRSRHPRERGR